MAKLTTITNLRGPQGAPGPQGLPGVGSAAWVPDHAYTAGSVVQAPDGSWLSCDADHTSGAVFDATEQGNWSAVAGKDGTLATAALNAAYGPEKYPSRKVSPHASTVFPVVPAIASVEFPLPSANNNNRHNAFPCLARLANGQWFTVWRSATDHQVTADGRIWASTSNDGLTWSAPAEISTSDVVGATDRRDPTVAVVPGTGEVLLTFYDVGTKRSYLKRSTDNGTTWTTSTEIPFTYTNNTLTFVAAPIAIRSDGMWFCAAYDDAPTSRVQIIHSTDSGATWSAPQVLTPAAPFSGYLEPNIIPLDGLNMLMLIRSADQQFIYSTTANNTAGSNWTTLKTAFAGTNNPRATRFVSGTVAVLYRDNHNGDLMTRTSFDSGATWSLPRRLSSSATFSADASAVEDPEHHGHALMVWASEDNGPSCIQATTISEAGGTSQFGPHLHPNRATTFASVPSRVWLPASAFRAATGTPAEGAVNDWPGWLLSHGETDTVRTTFQLPDGWRYVNAVAHWAPVDANTGNVVLSNALGVATFQYNEPALAAGATVTGSAGSTGGVVGAHRTSRLFATQAVAENSVYKLTVSRAGTNASDTYTSDVVLLGVELDNATTPVIV